MFTLKNPTPDVAAGLVYRLGRLDVPLESLLGLQRSGNTLKIEPLIPQDWPGFTLTYRFGATQYHFEVNQGTTETTSMTLDDQRIERDALLLIDDGIAHRVHIECRVRSPDRQAREYSKANDE